MIYKNHLSKNIMKIEQGKPIGTLICEFLMEGKTPEGVKKNNFQGKQGQAAYLFGKSEEKSGAESLPGRNLEPCRWEVAGLERLRKQPSGSKQSYHHA